MVTINSGKLEGTEFFYSVPKSKWRELLNAKAHLVRYRLTYDCREVMYAFKEANEVYADFGFASPDDMIRQAYKVNPADARIVMEWLEIYAPDWAIPFAKAKTEATGIIREQSPLERIQAIWRKADPDEQEAIRFWISEQGGRRDLV